MTRKADSVARAGPVQLVQYATAVASAPTGRVLTLPATRATALRGFQGEALALEDRAPARIAHLTLYVVAALIVAVVVWAALSRVDRVVVAPGRLVHTAPNMVVQPLETSVIRTINVATGDVVRAGQTLATLDPTFSTADVAQLSARLSSRAAQVARLEAERDERAFSVAPDAGDDARLQAQTFAQRRAHRHARLRDFDERIARTRAGIDTSQTEQRMLVPRLAVAQELEAMRVQLLGGQLGSRVQVLESRSARLDLEGRIERLRQGEVELAHEVRRTEAERDSFIEEWRQAVLEELARVRSERDSLAEELAKARLRAQLVVLTAPGDAVVLEAANRSVGSVLREAETLFVLVPLAGTLEAELTVQPRDIGRLRVGDTVRVKLDAFPYQEHGAATGIVRTISEGAFAGDQDQHNREVVFRVRIQLTETALRNLPAALRLIPGMTVSGEIRVGDRNVLSYFLSPLLRGLDESLREP